MAKAEYDPTLMRDRIAQLTALRMRNLLRHRERYVKAWIAATGVHPCDAELCHRTETDDQFRIVDVFWVRRRDTNTPATGNGSGGS